MEQPEFWLAIGLAANAGVLWAGFGYALSGAVTRRGGLLFWRIGRFGGSFYIARRRFNGGRFVVARLASFIVGAALTGVAL